MGYPFPDRPAIIDEICAHLASGTSLLDICKIPGMPKRETVYDWIEKDAELHTRIAHAREIGQDAEIERTIEMADAATPEDYNAVKLRIWARQWRASKIAPRKYGDRIAAEITGAGGGPLQGEITINLVPALEGRRAAEDSPQPLLEAERVTVPKTIDAIGVTTVETTPVERKA